MNKIKNNINKILLGVFMITFLGSCNDDGYDDYTQDLNPSVEMNGEWYIDISDAAGNVLVPHAHHITYDTNDGNNTMYINDNKAGWYLKGKLNIDPENLTFSVTDEENLLDPGSTFTITEGKIFKNVGTSKGGNATDSIYFKAEFSYDPGNVLIYSGTKRTGFLEDNY